MKTFTHASSVKISKEKIDLNKVEKFIDMFNKIFMKKSIHENGDGSFSMNTGLTKIPYLNFLEVEHAKALAKHQGWNLSQHEDNYQTTTYRMQKI